LPVAYHIITLELVVQVDGLAIDCQQSAADDSFIVAAWISPKFRTFFEAQGEYEIIRER